MKEIISNEELKKIYEKGQGFVYNDYTPYSKYGKQFNKLHKANSTCMDPSNQNRMKVEGIEKKHTKYFFDTYDEAIAWLKQNRSQVGYSNCGLCFR